MNITTEEIFIEREFTWHIICAANSNNSETQVIRLCRLSKTRAWICILIDQAHPKQNHHKLFLENTFRWTPGHETQVNI